ncbi:MAG: hydrogenase maturation nickel metallochaperone HypA [Bacillota bacterium]
MHELSLIREVMGILEKSARENGIGSIEKVRLVVGKLVAALPGSMEFCFYALAKDPLFVDARLEIEETDIRGRCQSCGKEFLIAGLQFHCSCCGSPAVEVIAGDEFYVDYFEGD